MTLAVRHLDPAGAARAQERVKAQHYLHACVPAIARPEAWGIVCQLEDVPRARRDATVDMHGTAQLAEMGALIVARPQSTASRGWYGSVEGVAAGRCEVTRWQVLNLARVWLAPRYQGDGARYELTVPGYWDRRGVWRSTLASDALRLLAERVGFEYLLARPPVFLDEPYEVTWLLSYCNTRLHRGTIYRAAGWELYGTNAAGMQTWRVLLPALTAAQRAAIEEASRQSERARRYRGERERSRAQAALVGV